MARCKQENLGAVSGLVQNVSDVVFSPSSESGRPTRHGVRSAAEFVIGGMIARLSVFRKKMLSENIAKKFGPSKMLTPDCGCASAEGQFRAGLSPSIATDSQSFLGQNDLPGSSVVHDAMRLPGSLRIIRGGRPVLASQKLFHFTVLHILPLGPLIYGIFKADKLCCGTRDWRYYRSCWFFWRHNGHRSRDAAHLSPIWRGHIEQRPRSKSNHLVVVRDLRCNRNMLILYPCTIGLSFWFFHFSAALFDHSHFKFRENLTLHVGHAVGFEDHVLGWTCCQTTNSCKLSYSFRRQPGAPLYPNP
jgi:hypothetical protein